MAEKKVQPKSPQHEGVDPLTKGERLYPKVDTKTESEKLRKAEAKSEPASTEKVEETVADQNEVNAKDNTPNDLLPEDDNSRGASDPESSEPATDEKSPEEVKSDRPAETPKGKTSGSTTSSR